MEHTNNTPALMRQSSWNDLSNFSVFSVSGGNQLYSNGYQQLRVRVVVEARHWLSYSVPLTQAEFDSVVLIDGLTGQELSKDRHQGDVGVWKYTDRQDNRFRQLPPNMPIRGEVPSGEFVYTKDFYVTCSADRPIDLQLRITRADGETFRSDKLDEFGALTLTPLPPAVYRSEQYSLSRTSASYFSTTGDIEKVELFMLDLIVDQQRMRFVTDLAMGAHLKVGSSDSRYSGYYLVGYGHGQTLRTGMPVSWEQPAALGRNRSADGRVALVLAYGKLGQVWIRETLISADLELRDMHGNFHALRVELADNPLTVRVVSL